MEERRSTDHLTAVHINSLKEIITLGQQHTNESIELLRKDIEMIRAEQRNMIQIQSACNEDEFRSLNTKIDNIEKRLAVVEGKPAQEALEKQKQAGKTIRTVLLTAAIMAFLSVFGYNVKEYYDNKAPVVKTEGVVTK